MSSCAVLLTMLAACSSVSDYPLYPSYDELAHKGFYVYVVPEGEVTRRGWLQTVWIYSWDLHCKRLGPETSPNPISVSYRGPDDRKEMGVVISPRSIAWDHGWPSEEVSLRFPWTKDNAAEYYIEDGLLTIQFEDWLGTSVEITSRLPLTEVVGLINRLEYHGPPREMVSNPWDYTKCQD
jgi:hypothetical protein